MDYVKTATREIVSASDLRRTLNASFRDGADLSDFGCVPLTPAAPPPEVAGQRVLPTGLAMQRDGAWVREWVSEPLSPDDVKRDIEERAEQRLFEFGKTRSYNSVDSIAKYKDITDDEIAALPAGEQPLVRKFRAECCYLALATARTWAVLLLILGDVEAGRRPLPAGYDEIEPELPVLEWPN